MEARLKDIQAALAELTDAELDALIQASYRAPRLAPALLAWLEAACDQEWSRRMGREYKLLPPETAIDPAEVRVSIEAARMLRATFDITRSSPALLNLLDTLLTMLTGGERKH